MTWRPKTCHHEAAHAVVAAARGVEIEYVTTDPREVKYAGGTKVRWRDDTPWQDYGAVLAAGPIADDVFTELRARSELVHESGDYELLRRLARDVRRQTRSGDPFPGFEVPHRASVHAIAKIAWTEAHGTLIENYGAVLAIAARLGGSRRTVTGAEVYRLLGCAVPAEMPNASLAADFWPPNFMRGWWTHETQKARAA